MAGELGLAPFVEARSRHFDADWSDPATGPTAAALRLESRIIEASRQWGGGLRASVFRTKHSCSSTNGKAAKVLFCQALCQWSFVMAVGW